MSAANVLDAETGRTELLDRIDDEQRAVRAAEVGETVQVDGEPVRPLHGADDKGPRAVVHVLGECLDGDGAVAVAHDPHLPDVTALCELHPGDRDLEELQIADHHVVVRLEWDCRGDHVEPVGRALDERDLVVRGLEEPCSFTHSLATGLVECDVMRGGVPVGAHHRSLEESLDRHFRLDRGEPDAGGVEERLVSQPGEVLSCVRDSHWRPSRLGYRPTTMKQPARRSPHP